LLVVFGERVPKTVGMRHPAETVRRFGRLMDWSRAVLHPASRPLEAVSAFLLRRVLRIEPVKESEVNASTEELQVLVEESNDLTETEGQIVQRALELSEMRVRDIMVPRNEVVCLDVDHAFAANLQVAIESRHTRFPLIRGHIDNALGLIHIKDLLKLAGQKEAGLHAIRRDLLPVPDKMPLDQLLKFFLQEHAHLALVVDEFGGTLGVVFLDNVIEQLVGDIHDEFDELDPGFHRIDEHEFFVEGAFGLHELAEHADIELESGEVVTVGGYLTEHLGHVPHSGEFLDIEGYRATVTKTDGRRVLQVHFKQLLPATATPPGEIGKAAVS
jgi:CBS domain containing-hemolysin-like protein